MDKFIVMSRCASLFVNRFYVADGPGWPLRYPVACCGSASRPSTHCSETTRSCSRRSTALFQESVEHETTDTVRLQVGLFFRFFFLRSKNIWKTHLGFTQRKQKFIGFYYWRIGRNDQHEIVLTTAERQHLSEHVRFDELH